MKKLFTPLLLIVAAMFAYAPVMIANAPYESSMGLVQKIFYFHVPSWFVMFTAVFICGIQSANFLFRRKPSADRIAVAAGELVVLFGLLGLVTGPLWGRKAWGVWWQWDARLTMALLLELIFIGYLLVRKYGGPGSEKLAAAMAILSVTRLASTSRQPFRRPGKHMELFTWLEKSLRPVATMRAPASLAS